jgi:hypothetical protein
MRVFVLSLREICYNSDTVCHEQGRGVANLHLLKAHFYVYS